MRLFRLLVLVQGIYFLATAIWPIVHLDSFMAVTGHKTDQWLVQTVGALLIPIALTLLSFRKREQLVIPAVLLGGGSALALAIVDFYFAGALDLIPDIYQLDGVVEIVFVIGWVYVSLRTARN